MIQGALKEYLRLLDEEEYFDAHEVLEEAWHPLRLNKHPLSNLAKGLINAAIAFEHLKRDRQNAQAKARKVIVSFDRHKQLCTDEIDQSQLFITACKKIEQLKIQYKEVFDVLVSC